jgi:hypothetical protein
MLSKASFLVFFFALGLAQSQQDFDDFYDFINDKPTTTTTTSSTTSTTTTPSTTPTTTTSTTESSPRNVSKTTTNSTASPPTTPLTTETESPPAYLSTTNSTATTAIGASLENKTTIALFQFSSSEECERKDNLPATFDILNFVQKMFTKLSNKIDDIDLKIQLLSRTTDELSTTTGLDVFEEQDESTTSTPSTTPTPPPVLDFFEEEDLFEKEFSSFQERENVNGIISASWLEINWQIVLPVAITLFTCILFVPILITCICCLAKNSNKKKEEKYSKPADTKAPSEAKEHTYNEPQMEMSPIDGDSADDEVEAIMCGPPLTCGTGNI